VRESGALKQQALTNALTEARKRAQDAAAQAGGTLGEVERLSLDCSGWAQQPESPLLPTGPLSVTPTDVKLQVTAKVTFRYK